MKTIGLIGGTTWQSTKEYYRILNEEISRRLGGHHSAKVVLTSIDFEELEVLTSPLDRKSFAALFSREAKRLASAGVDFFLICANTPHIVADDVAKAVNIPMLSILDVVAKEAHKREIERVGLLGTKITMEEGYFARHLERSGVRTLTPDEVGRQEIQRVILEELDSGQIMEGSRRRFQEIIGDLKSQGAQGVVLGCTEIPLLIRQEDVEIPVLDTTLLHAQAAVEKALEK